MADLADDIAQQAAEPVSVTADGQSTTGRSLADMIAADRYLQAKTAVRKRRRGVLFTKLIPPGPLSDADRGAYPADAGGGP